jgi:hypothetical protein
VQTPGHAGLSKLFRIFFGRCEIFDGAVAIG